MDFFFNIVYDVLCGEIYIEFCRTVINVIKNKKNINQRPTLCNLYTESVPVHLSLNKVFTQKNYQSTIIMTRVTYCIKLHERDVFLVLHTC